MKQYTRFNIKLLLCTVLVFVTFLIYLPVRNHEFIRYDDDGYVTRNLNVQSGLSVQNIKWAFTTVCNSNWHPLTWLSHMLDCQLFGDRPGLHHLVSVLLHITNTLLLFIVLNRITKTLWQSAFIAALFALHPLHVESVAWVAERKDVLSTFFWFLTMLAYTCYAERPSIVRYLVTIVLFAFGLMSKPMLVTLPFVLLLLDYWPFERLRNYKFVNLLLEKVPFFLLCGASSVITFIAQRKGGAMAVIAFRERIANAVFSYLAYIGKMIWPGRLAVLYPYPADMIPADKTVIYTIILVLITVFVVYYGRKHKYLFVGWLWYLGTLVPVIGIVQVGAQAMADRYTYVPLIGLFIIVAFGSADLLRSFAYRKYILSAVAIVILFACTLTTSAQLKYWKDSSTLFEHTLALTKNNIPILNNYARILHSQGKHAQALECIAKVLSTLPNSPEVHVNYGNALKDLGRTDEAIEHYKIAIRLDPNMVFAHYVLGMALASQGKYDEAVEQYRVYLGPAIDISQPYQELIKTLSRQGKVEEGAGQFQRALASSPSFVEVLSNLGFALAQSGKPQQAIECYSKALQNDPTDVITHGRLALALASLGRIDEAIEQCRIVLQSRPGDVQMYNILGALLQAKGRFDEAAECYQKVLKIEPNNQKARENLSILPKKQDKPQN